MSEYRTAIDDIHTARMIARRVHTARMIAWRAQENCETLDPGDILDVLGRPDDTEIRRWKQEQD